MLVNKKSSVPDIDDVAIFDTDETNNTSTNNVDTNLLILFNMDLTETSNPISILVKIEGFCPCKTS